MLSLCLWCFEMYQWDVQPNVESFYFIVVSSVRKWISKRWVFHQLGMFILWEVMSPGVCVYLCVCACVCGSFHYHNLSVLPGSKAHTSVAPRPGRTTAPAAGVSPAWQPDSRCPLPRATDRKISVRIGQPRWPDQHEPQCSKGTMHYAFGICKPHMHREVETHTPYTTHHISAANPSSWVKQSGQMTPKATFLQCPTSVPNPWLNITRGPPHTLTRVQDLQWGSCREAMTSGGMCY